MNPLFYQIALSPDFVGMVEDHRDRHLAYCEKWGYTYLFEDGYPGYPETTDGGWFRLERILTHMKSGEYSHFFWVDPDVFVADLDHDMRETLPEWAFFAATCHPYPWHYADAVHIQTGQMYFRACSESIAFLEECFKQREWAPEEQSAINFLLLWDMEQSSRWGKGFRLLPSRWNRTAHDEPYLRPIVSAYHGYLSGAERRRQMLLDSELFPFVNTIKGKLYG